MTALDGRVPEKRAELLRAEAVLPQHRSPSGCLAQTACLLILAAEMAEATSILDRIATALEGGIESIDATLDRIADGVKPRLKYGGGPG